MTKFILRCLIFSLPILVLFALPFFIFVRSGEALPISSVVHIQQEVSTSTIYMSGLTNAGDWYYKVTSLVRRNPEITVFGTSRTLKIRSDFFEHPELFYNAGYNDNASMTTSDLPAFIEAVPADAKLKVILLDVSGFMGSPDEPHTVYRNDFFESADTFLSSGWRTIYRYVFDGGFSLAKVDAATSSIGLEAIVNDFGYRSDGSLARTATALMKPSAIASQIAENVSDINAGFLPAFFEKNADTRNLSAIDEFLQKCKDRGISVIGYLSPFAQEIHTAMSSLQNAYGAEYRNEPAILDQIFEKYGYHFYDIRDIKTIGSSDMELYDAYHPTERATLRMLAYLAAREPELSPYLDRISLQKQIADAPF
ncbi:MAG: hypothetical protein KGH93_02840 [Patescibacteria group bacterium]|nr:hypothetical protein [Patescibacteria group bacterium]MDE1946107.1 hypothetical protein [Patescibacteria group bacterium]